MSLRRSGLGWAALAFVAAASSLPAAGADLAGTAVRRDVTDASGNRFAVTVRPPADRAVDMRFFDAFEISADDSTSVAQASEDSNGPLVDVSGYVMDVELLSSAATCTKKITVKNKPVSLGGNKSFSVTSSSPPLFVAVTAFPKSGNVDTYVLDGSTPCESSKKPAGQLDNATCVASSCTATANLIGQIKNPASAGASYAGAINIVLSN